MAYISGTSSTSSSSSIYGTRNVLSGLASGIDTESLIENAVTGYKTKITSLQQKKTQYEWKQEAYRSIIDKLSSFADKYTSYQSSTNLMSSAFYDSGLKIVSQGVNADRVAASGKTNSDVQVLGVKQLATAATYTSTTLGGSSSPITGDAVAFSDLGEDFEGKELTFTLDGVTKKITLKAADTYGDADGLVQSLQQQLNDAFGTGKITLTSTGDASSFAMEFSVSYGSTLSLGGSACASLGLTNGATSYVNSGNTLEQILGSTAFDSLTQSGTDENGEALYDFVINGVSVGQFSKNSTLESVITAVNSNADAGVTVRFSKITNQFTFTTKETGTAQHITMEDGGLSAAIFGQADARNGQDAIFSARVNGQLLDGVSRSSNSFEIDGLSLNLKGTFGDYTESNGSYSLTDPSSAALSAVTFTSQMDSEKIVSAIKSMVDDFNTMVTEIKKAYSTLPAQKSNGSAYLPLSDEDRSDMSESAIAKYEEQAKQGLLFGDSELSDLYTRLIRSLSVNAGDSLALKNIGITASYTSGQTTISLDENKLKAALESDPEKVKNLLSGSGSGSSSMLSSMKQTIEKYAKTTGTKGLLIQKAGSSLAPTSLLDNTLKKSIDKLEEQITKWQEKMDAQIDRYTTQFTQLEKLISQMNSQSSTLNGLMGSY
ncbi:MAG: flagellar filament capping protein FliD [Firmicutes bacterium]|nr:flagellar filament capping protein FliD [Bacillota bacterium]